MRIGTNRSYLEVDGVVWLSRNWIGKRLGRSKQYIERAVKNTEGMVLDEATGLISEHSLVALLEYVNSTASNEILKEIKLETLGKWVRRRTVYQDTLRLNSNNPIKTIITEFQLVQSPMSKFINNLGRRTQ